MKRFGIVMTENNLKAYALAKGINVLWKDMTEAEKTQVRYNYMLEKTSFFSGDAAKTINSTANKTKVLKANLGDLYGVVGKNLEPIWNEFLTNLNDMVVAITENEKATEGLTSAFQALGKVAGGVTWITKNFVLGVQNIASALSIPFENHKIQKNLEKVVKDSRVITKEWVAQNKAFMEQVDSQYDIDIQNSVSYTDELQAEYERRLKILNEFNKSYLSGEEKTVNEKLRLENLGDTKTEEFIPSLKIPKILKGVRENDYDVILNKIKSGKEGQIIGLTGGLGDTIGAKESFDKNLTDEEIIDKFGFKQVDNIKTAIKQFKQYSLSINKLFESHPAEMSSSSVEDFLIERLKNTRTQKIEKKSNDGVKAQDVSVDTNLGNNKTTGGTDPLTLEELQANYKAEKKAFEEYAKQRRLTKEIQLSGAIS